MTQAKMCIYYILILILILMYLQTHKKTLRIQQHPASAFRAALKQSTWTGQAQTSKTSQANTTKYSQNIQSKYTVKTSQANTTKYYSMHSLVGTLRQARKLAPLDLANVLADA
jgi:hypothetical protein